LPSSENRYSLIVGKLAPQKIETVPIRTLKHHPKNPRKGDVKSITESIEHNGFYGVVVAQKSTGYVLAGNHRMMAAKAAGLDSLPVAYVDVDDATALKILLADNRTNDLATYDNKELAELLADVSNTIGLDGTGFDEAFLDGLIGELAQETTIDSDPNYERKVEAPIYEPKSDNPPPIETLYDQSKTNQILERIERAELPDKIKVFLRAAAARHTVFDYEQIAEFYAHADKSTQTLFEDSALVIIDFNSAIEKGFVKLVGDLADAYDKDNEEREEGDDSEDE